MTTNFPTSVDTFPSAATLNGKDLDNVDGAGLSHHQWMANVGDAISAIETSIEQVRIVQQKHTGSNYTLSSASLADVDTSLDCTLTAKTNDWIEYSISGHCDGGHAMALDVATIVSGSPVNYFSSGTSTFNSNGIGAFICEDLAFQTISGSFFYKVQAGDISSGTVKLRLRYIIYGGGNRIIYGATGGDNFIVTARNLTP